MQFTIELTAEEALEAERKWGDYDWTRVGNKPPIASVAEKVGRAVKAQRPIEAGDKVVWGSEGPARTVLAVNGPFAWVTSHAIGGAIAPIGDLKRVTDAAQRR